MFPFDRLIRSMDEWALRNPNKNIYAQIGDGEFMPKHMPYTRMVAPSRFREIYDEATMIVAHAGMGSVISAAEIGKPIVLLPRVAAWKEHTTDHQLHTAEWLKSKSGVFVASSEDDLDRQIGRATKCLMNEERLQTTAPPEFVSRLREVIMS